MNRLRVIGRLLEGADLRESAERLLQQEIGHATGDGGLDGRPTVLGENDQIVSGDPEGLHWQQTARGFEGYDEDGLLRQALTMYQGQPAQIFYGPGGERDIQRVLTSERDTWYTADGRKGMEITQSTLAVYAQDGETVAFSVALGKAPGVVAGVGLNMPTDLVGSALNARNSASGLDTDFWACVYNAAGTKKLSIDYNGRLVWEATGVGLDTVASELTRSIGGLSLNSKPVLVNSSTSQTAYIKPVKASVVGPAASVSAGNAWTDVVSVTISTTETCDIDVSGMLYGTLTLGAARNPAWGWRVQLDTAAPPYNAPRQSGSTGQVVAGVVSARYTNVAAGTHTLKLQAQTFNAGDTIALGVSSAELHVVAMLS